MVITDDIDDAADAVGAGSDIDREELEVELFSGEKTVAIEGNADDDAAAD